MIPSDEMSPLDADAELVAQTRRGDGDAFGRIVARYQALICALAYNATGSLAQSEDLAQEAFVIAWKQLPALREPEKLRSWLCGIVRNLGRRAREARSSSPCSGRNRWRPQPPRWPRRNLALSIRPSAGRRRQSSGARWRPSPRPTANP